MTQTSAKEMHHRGRRAVLTMASANVRTPRPTAPRGLSQLGGDRAGHEWLALRDDEQIIACNTSLFGQKHFLIGITRVRNEALILRDTLDYVGKHVDAIVAYDDASTDRTLEILGDHPKVGLVVTNRRGKRTLRHDGLLRVDIAGFCCRRRANICSSTGYFASTRMSALPEIYADS